MKDKVEERKEKDQKPKKLFSFVAQIFDCGTISGYGWEYRDIGKIRNQKMAFPTKEEFIAEIRSQMPSALPVVEDVLNAVYDANEKVDTEKSQKIATIGFDIYSSGFVDKDCCIIERPVGPGAPKAWRKEPRTFISDLKYLVGDLSDTFEPLLEGNQTSLDTSTVVDELTDISEDDEFSE